MHDKLVLDAGRFAARLDQFRQRYPASNPDLVAEMVHAVLGTMRGDLSATETALLGEIEELAQTVANARAEIAAIGADDITESHIPSATDELDAIVAHTATATNSILECCEALDEVMPRLTEGDSQVVQNVVTRIYEACSFQDITGQRITKVVATLKAIESKVGHIIDVFQQDRDQRTAGKAPPLPPEGPVDAAASLLNGPQLPAAAMDQSDIDALLASFD
jgi:chemotaxis protein CheZ